MGLAAWVHLSSLNNSHSNEHRTQSDLAAATGVTEEPSEIEPRN
jgi:hypothetical protein